MGKRWGYDMDYITVHTLRKLKKAGFSYPDYEHFLNKGMVYYYQDNEYFIGGRTFDSFTEFDKAAARDGEWLPEACQLLSWLRNTDFKVDISVEGNYFAVQATDLIIGSVFLSEGYSLADTLAFLIRKICKSKQREYVPQSVLRLQILENDDA